MSHHIDFNKVQQDFAKELTEARGGKKTSLPFIKQKISPKPIVKEGEIFQVLVIGGTIFRKALAKKTKTGIKFIERDQKYQPAFNNKAEFDNFIEKEISPDVKTIALNFAYPLKPLFKNGRLDGILNTAGIKGNVFEDLVGKEVGSEIEKLLAKKRKQKVVVSVANDTICLLLCGLTRANWDELAAGVVGTGINFALFLEKDLAVNIESSDFKNFPQSPEGQLIDSNSTNPGDHVFEKEAGGAYLYNHFNLIVQARGINQPLLNSTQDLDKLAHGDGESAKIAKELLFNSASLVAAEIAGILNFKKKDMVFVVEGSLFWLSNNYRKNVGKVLAKISPKYKAKFVKVSESTVLGAAKLIA